MVSVDVSSEAENEITAWISLRSQHVVIVGLPKD